MQPKQQTTIDNSGGRFLGLRSIARSVAHAIKRPPAADLIGDTAAPNSALAGTGVIRQAITSQPLTAAITPARMAQIIAQAATLADTASYFEAAERLEECDLHYRSLISTRKLAVAGLDLVIEAFDTSRVSKKIAELVTQVLTADCVQNMLLDLLDGLSKGVSIVEIAWNTTGALWIPASYAWRDPRFFDFDKTDGETVKLRGAGGILQDLPPASFIVHKPRLKTGLPVRSGLALPGGVAWCLKQMLLTNWAGFAEIYGQPMRLGTFQKGSKKEDVMGLKKALASLGSDAYAVMPSDMKVEFLNGVAAGNVGIFENFEKYLEDQQSRLVLGQTLTSGTGSGAGSYALGLVHNEVRMDILRSDAKQLASTLIRDLIRPLIDFNFGEEFPLPHIRFAADEGEDLVALATVLSLMVPVGIAAPAKWARDKFGIPEPEDGETLLQAAAVPAAPATPKNGKPLPPLKPKPEKGPTS
ncbi:Mu-like prophage protein gp29 [Burkholderia sp. YR290]|nr:Mu-like prophage protein gp29 [Burkholderia sp. YR290]